MILIELKELNSNDKNLIIVLELNQNLIVLI